MTFKNIPILFQKEEIKKFTKIIEDKIKDAKEEFYKYIITEKTIDIKYEIKKSENRYFCAGSLFYGGELIRKYNHIDELFLDLDSIKLDIISKNLNVREDNIDKYEYIIKCTLQNNYEKFENQYLLVKDTKELDTNFEIDLTGNFYFNCDYEVINPKVVKKVNNISELIEFCERNKIEIPKTAIKGNSIIAGGEDGLLINDKLEPVDWLENIQEEEL